MSSHKALKSVVRSVADSFTSLMNYSGDDYVMGHLLNAACAAATGLVIRERPTLDLSFR